MRKRPRSKCIGFKGVPSCRLFRKGKAVEQLRGMQTEADDRALIERQILPLADEEVQGADGERAQDLAVICSTIDKAALCNS